MNRGRLLVQLAKNDGALYPAMSNTGKVYPWNNKFDKKLASESYEFNETNEQGSPIILTDTISTSDKTFTNRSVDSIEKPISVNKSKINILDYALIQPKTSKGGGSVTYMHTLNAPINQEEKTSNIEFTEMKKVEESNGKAIHLPMCSRDSFLHIDDSSRNAHSVEDSANVRVKNGSKTEITDKIDDFNKLVYHDKYLEAQRFEMKDTAVSVPMSYKEKVDRYLRNLETDNRIYDGAPFKFSLNDNERSIGICTDNFYIETNYADACRTSSSSINVLADIDKVLLTDHTPSICVDQKELHILNYGINQTKKSSNNIERDNFEKNTVDDTNIRTSEINLYVEDYVGIMNSSMETLVSAENQLIDTDKVKSRKLCPDKSIGKKFVEDKKEIGRGKEIEVAKPNISIYSDDSLETFSENTVDSDFYPPTTRSASSSNSEGEHSDVKQGSEPEIRATIIVQPTSLNSNKLKKDLCLFCFEEVDHFARHLIKKHSDDESVKKISNMRLKSNERHKAIMALRKKGNFLLNEQKKVIKVVRQPNSNQVDAEYFPCINCYGFYEKSYLWRHRKICKTKEKNQTSSSKNHLTESQTFLATTGILGNFLNKSRLKQEVLGIMRPDKISFAAKSDSLICLFGESYLNKHKKKQMNIVVSNKMRELARLKLALKECTTIENLLGALKPNCYEFIVAATKMMCGYDIENKTYRSSSLALHMGTSLKFLCDIATKGLLTNNPLFIDVDREKTIKEIKHVRFMIEKHWCNDVASLANKVSNEQKFSRPKLLPFTEDIKSLNQYVKESAERAYEKLKIHIGTTNKEDISNDYKTLSECTLVLVLIFNRKRVGEVQFLNIPTYENSNFSINQEECLSSLTPLEKRMSASFKRVVVFGKGGKPVPILFTKLMQRYMGMLLKVQKNTEVVPLSNKYVFAYLNSDDRWMSGPSVLRKYAYKCGAKNPHLLTSTRFRKQLATILQLMNFESDEMEQIARFMGHTEKTHKDFYRLTEDVYQTAKVAKVLLLLNVGKGIEFKGKSLAEIEVEDEVLECDGEKIIEDYEEVDTLGQHMEDKIEIKKESAEMEKYKERQQKFKNNVDQPQRNVYPGRNNIEHANKSENEHQNLGNGRMRWESKKKI